MSTAHDMLRLPEPRSELRSVPIYQQLCPTQVREKASLLRRMITGVLVRSYLGESLAFGRRP